MYHTYQGGGVISTKHFYDPIFLPLLSCEAWQNIMLSKLFRGQNTRAVLGNISTGRMSARREFLLNLNIAPIPNAESEYYTHIQFTTMLGYVNGINSSCPPLSTPACSLWCIILRTWSMALILSCLDKTASSEFKRGMSHWVAMKKWITMRAEHE